MSFKAADRFKGGHEWQYAPAASAKNGPAVYQCVRCEMQQYDYVIEKWSGITDCPWSHKGAETIKINPEQFTSAITDASYAKKESSMFTTGTVETLGGYRAVLRSATSGEIVWESDEVYPTETPKDENGKVVGEMGINRAASAARARLKALESVIAQTKLKS